MLIHGTASEIEFDRLNLQFLTETKEKNNKVSISNSQETITFENGNEYSYNSDDKAIYLNTNIKIAEGITNITYSLTEDEDEYQKLKVSVEMNEAKRTHEYYINLEE